MKIITHKILYQVYLLPFVKITYDKILNGDYELIIGWFNIELSISYKPKTKMKNKRFQECNWLVKAWRFRYYCLIPFKWLHTTFIIKPKDDFVKGRNLWKLLIGSAQIKMKWVYTQEEVRKHEEEKFIDSLK